MARTLTSARRRYQLTALLARRALREARAAQARGAAAVGTVVITHQIAAATTTQTAIADMLAEQGIETSIDALLNVAGFTSGVAFVEQALADIETAAAQAQAQVNWQFDRLVASLVQDAARAAESVAIAARPDVRHVRFVSPPCCSRCAILAGRVYRWSTGFERHPGCDCSMIPTTVASPLRQDPERLVADGLVTGLSKADRAALDAGADLNQIVNARLKSTSLLEAGQSLRRGGRPTPAGIFRRFPDDRERALAELARYGYVR